MSRLDRYVSSYFLSSYGVCLLFFVGMFVVIDLFGKSDEIVENAQAVSELGHSSAMLLLQYYSLMVPFIFLQVAPFVTVVAAMFAITRLRRNNELVPMIVAGLSVFRVLVPVFAFSLLLAAFMVAVQEYVSPSLADSRDRCKKLLFDAEETTLVSDFYSLGGGCVVTVQGYDVNKKTIACFDVSDLNQPDEPTVAGSNAWWDEEAGAFLYEVETTDAAGAAVKEVRSMPVTLSPSLIVSRKRGPHDLSYSQAQFLYEKTQEAKWKVLLHYHLTFPLSNLLLLLLALPFVLRQSGRSLLLGMVIAIVICAAYFSFDALMRNLGDKDVLHPVLAAWFGVIFFGSLGVVLIDNVKT